MINFLVFIGIGLAFGPLTALGALGMYVGCAIIVACWGGAE